MPGFFRAVAVDFDGTLTPAARPTEEVLGALAAARAEGRAIVLVTGRIVDELRAIFPDYARHVDLVVAENGAVLATPNGLLPLGRPIPAALDAALADEGIPFRRGRVILATRGEHDVLLLEAIRRLGLDCQLVRNRGELMVVPAGVSKGTGLRAGLAQLGISPHSTIGVGDAENDLALLDVCELGVAVANAVRSLKHNADVVLRLPDGEGVVQLLRGALLRGEVRVEPRRWQIALGRSPDGEPVRLPASQIDLLVAGGSGSGKSFAAGLLAEQLVQLGYLVCAIDPEGDHTPLGRLPGVVTLGGPQRLPDPEDVSHILEQGAASVVVDGSLCSAALREPWMVEAIEHLEERRRRSGVPHWLIIDEAQIALHQANRAGVIDPELKGHALVTWHPQHLSAAATRDLDFLLLLAGEAGIDEEVARAACAAARIDPAAVAPLGAALGLGEALLVRIQPGPEVRRLALGARWVRHVRHWHKYASSQLPAGQRFYFRRDGAPTGAVAGNLVEFRREVGLADADSLRHHARSGDFSRWLDEVIRDDALAAAFRPLEAQLRAAREPREVEALRRLMLERIEARYGV